MKFSEMVEQAGNFLRRKGRVSYRALQREFDLDEQDLTDLKEELLFSHPQVTDEGGRGLVWTEDQAGASVAGSGTPVPPPLSYTPPVEVPTAPVANGHHSSTLQSGTLPPASPPPAAYTPPTPRLPEHGEAPSSPVDRPGLYSPPAAHSPSPTSYSAPPRRSDFDDDVDVPPFMKR